MANTYGRCRQCGKPRTPRRHISKRGLCATCGNKNLRAALTQQSRRRGPVFERQVRAQIEALQQLIGE